MEKKIEKHITAEIVTDMKNDKRGRPFFSVKYGENKWLMCYIPKLRNSLEKGESYTVFTDGATEYEKLLDVVSDELGIEPNYDDQPRQPYKETVKVPTIGKAMAMTEGQWNNVELNTKLDKIITMLESVLSKQNP